MFLLKSKGMYITTYIRKVKVKKTRTLASIKRTGKLKFVIAELRIPSGLTVGEFGGPGLFVSEGIENVENDKLARGTVFKGTAKLCVTWLFDMFGGGEPRIASNDAFTENTSSLPSSITH